MTLYLTDRTTSEEIRTAKASGIIAGCKLYPAGATTNSEYGVTNIKTISGVLKTMEEEGMPLLIHGEATEGSVDVFDKEAHFISHTLQPLVLEFPKLKIVLEHITTSEAVEFVRSAASNVVATVTAHHLLFNRNEIFKGGIRPHFYCLPILKVENPLLVLLLLHHLPLLLRLLHLSPCCSLFLFSPPFYSYVISLYREKSIDSH